MAFFTRGCLLVHLVFGVNRFADEVFQVGLVDLDMPALLLAHGNVGGFTYHK